MLGRQVGYGLVQIDTFLFGATPNGPSRSLIASRFRLSRRRLRKERVDLLWTAKTRKPGWSTRRFSTTFAPVQRHAGRLPIDRGA